MGILAYKKITTEFPIGNQIIYELPTSTKRSAKMIAQFASEETRVWKGVCPPFVQYLACCKSISVVNEIFLIFP